MQTVDKEQERQEAQKIPEFQKKEKIKNLLYGVGIVIFLIVAFFYYRSPSYTGTPYIIQMAGITIEPGKTTVQELADSGFEIADGILKQKVEYYDISSPVIGKSYTELLALMKGGERYATIVVVNEDSRKQPLAQCTVREIAIDVYDEAAETTILDGVKFSELTADLFTASRGKPYDNYTGGSETTITVWEDAHYSLQLETATDGTTHRIQVRYE